MLRLLPYRNGGAKLEPLSCTWSHGDRERHRDTMAFKPLSASGGFRRISPGQGCISANGRYEFEFENKLTPGVLYWTDEVLAGHYCSLGFAGLSFFETWVRPNNKVISCHTKLNVFAD